MQVHDIVDDLVPTKNTGKYAEKSHVIERARHKEWHEATLENNSRIVRNS
jgi:hypothetical protein